MNSTLALLSWAPTVSVRERPAGTVQFGELTITASFKITA